jgi:LPXTG-site transpeptidase (sortase) family protein
MYSYQNEETTTYVSKTEERFVFLLVFVGVLALTYGFLFLVDFLPEKPANEIGTRTPVVTSTNTAIPIATEDAVIPLPDSDTRVDVGVDAYNNGSVAYDGGTSVDVDEREGIIDPYPERIIFDTLNNRTVPVLNPSSRSVEALDTALLSGVVRHPDSADFERTGTIFLFGHSSYLPNVMNKNFQAFNGIQKMTWGDTIRLQSSDTEYVYRVDRVYETSANDAEVKIETGKAKLTLVTCDSFGAKSDRFVVEATLIRENSSSRDTVSGITVLLLHTRSLLAFSREVFLAYSLKKVVCENRRHGPRFAVEVP